jgi:hypothetical protein
VVQKIRMRVQMRSEASSRLGRRERNFWMQRQGVQNRR